MGPVDLSDYSLGSSGISGVDSNYTQSLVQLNGKIQSQDFFVVGGPKSDDSNGNPKYDQEIDFDPDFFHDSDLTGGSADGIALYHERR